ncbi:hypothetical protein HZA97_02355 [Candidatus Woesearchaeota archaeon]|nr:hypothetical protein [Candidatus Woesearchaeota archaeon]
MVEMSLSKTKLEQIREDFEKEYYFKPPYDSYINGTGLVPLKELKNSGQKLKLKKGESLDDLCLHVTLSKELPSNVKLPELYKKVRVFYEIIGEIELE